MTAKKRAPRTPKKSAFEQSGELMARAEAADARRYARDQERARIRLERDRPKLEATLQALQWCDARRQRLASADITIPPIAFRVRRSEILLRRLHDSIVDSDGQQVDHLCMELLDALWWEIRALDIFQRWPRGGRSVGDVTRTLDALIEENAEATSYEARRRLNSAVPGHGLADRSVTTRLSARKKALARKKS